MKKKVLFIGCNHDQIPYLKKLLDQGYYVIGTDLNGDAPGRHLAHEFVQVSYTEIEKLAIKVKNVGLTS